jgi:hypothetical protein
MVTEGRLGHVESGCDVADADNGYTADCGICERKMQGATIRAGAYYRCTARTMAPGSALLRDHPKTVNLPEEPVVEALNGWIG